MRPWNTEETPRTWATGSRAHVWVREPRTATDRQARGSAHMMPPRRTERKEHLRRCNENEKEQGNEDHV